MHQSIRAEIIIDAPKEVVWSILSDLPRYEDWNPFIIKSEGRLAGGERLKNTIQYGENVFVFRSKVLKVLPYQYFDWRWAAFWVNGIFDHHHYFKIEELHHHQVKLIQGENFTGLLSKIIFKKIADDTRKGITSMNQSVKNLAEGIIHL